MTDDVPKTHFRRRGKPSTDSYQTAEDLPPRIIEFCQYVASGIIPSMAGAMVNPKAGEQQINRWLYDCPGVADWFRKHGADEQFKKARQQSGAGYANLVAQNQQLILLAAQRETLKEIEEGKVVLKDRLQIIKEGLVMAKIEGAQSPVEVKETSSWLEAFLQLPDGEQKALTVGQGTRKAIEEKTE